MSQSTKQKKKQRKRREEEKGGRGWVGKSSQVSNWEERKKDTHTHTLTHTIT